ncbi:MAG: SDR family oxidoreductase [Lactimicrobium sp.]|jgi:3-oxoacyl-[acyl-carrier protein] reductase|uniref:SDR family NAD(P)-dependent oxidoreductase n=1 Tax=Lactimicrobium sp. TaxID=2563780 RepID=UPI002F35C3BB
MGILENRTAIIIGASSGVGYGTALRYAKEGANVIAGARRLNKLEELANDAEKRGFTGKITPVKCDVDTEGDLDRILDAAVSAYGTVDILACIAQGALNDQRDFEHTDAANVRAFMEGGPVYTLEMIQKCLPYMKKQHYGRILTCASGAGIRYTPNTCAYGMAKAAIISLTKTAAMELGKYGITTNCFLPVATNQYFENGSSAAAIPVNIMNALAPTGVFGKPYEDVSPLLAFLASEQGSYINGQIIEIDGGMGQVSPATIMAAFGAMKKD